MNNTAKKMNNNENSKIDEVTDSFKNDPFFGKIIEKKDRILTILFIAALAYFGYNSFINSNKTNLQNYSSTLESMRSDYALVNDLNTQITALETKTDITEEEKLELDSLNNSKKEALVALNGKQQILKESEEPFISLSEFYNHNIVKSEDYYLNIIKSDNWKAETKNKFFMELIQLYAFRELLSSNDYNAELETGLFDLLENSKFVNLSVAKLLLSLDFISQEKKDDVNKFLDKIKSEDPSQTEIINSLVLG